MNNDEKYFKIVHDVAKYSQCLHKHIGAVLVKDRKILCIGKNKAPAFVTSCTELNHCFKPKSSSEGQNNDVCLAVHAEMDVISKCAKLGISVINSTLYCNYRPCFSCLKILVNSGISEIVYEKDYKCPCEDLYQKVVKESGIKIRQYKKTLESS